MPLEPLRGGRGDPFTITYQCHVSMSFCVCSDVPSDVVEGGEEVPEVPEVELEPQAQDTLTQVDRASTIGHHRH